MKWLEGTRWRWLVFWLVLLVVAFGAGYLVRPPEVETLTDVRILKVEKFVSNSHEQKAKTRVVFVDRFIHPDGGVSERIEEREDDRGTIDTQVRRETTEDRKEITITKTARPRYHFGLWGGYSLQEPALRFGQTNVVIGGTAGIRLGDTPLFLDAVVVPQMPMGGAGLSVEIP